jgi:surface antigen
MEEAMRILKLLCGALLMGSLSGCYVYSAPYPYYSNGYYSYGDPYYYSGYGAYYDGSGAYAQATQQGEQQEAYCREYSHKIMVDNSLQEAHGTACQQPDGSWKTVD